MSSKVITQGTSLLKSILSTGPDQLEPKKMKRYISELRKICAMHDKLLFAKIIGNLDKNSEDFAKLRVLYPLK